MRKSRLIYGIGVNDADYPVQPKVNGKQTKCKYYRVWHHMMERCYSQKLQQRFPTYIGCTVCEEWLKFSQFKAWMETQDWVGKDLDKDLLMKENKIYSPATCVFIDRKINLFLTECTASRGEYKIGVKWEKSAAKFRALCCDNGKQIHLGLFVDEAAAHLAWKSYKHKVACKLADDQSDFRVANALRSRYCEDAQKESL